VCNNKCVVLSKPKISEKRGRSGRGAERGGSALSADAETQGAFLCKLRRCLACQSHACRRSHLTPAAPAYHHGKGNCKGPAMRGMLLLFCCSAWHPLSRPRVPEPFSCRLSAIPSSQILAPCAPLKFIWLTPQAHLSAWTIRNRPHASALEPGPGGRRGRN
jgi:hypothetical protein